MISYPEKQMASDASEDGHYIVFAGNDYLGLAKHPDLKQAAMLAIEKYGVNFFASRKTTGTADIHLELEKALAEFKGQSDAVVFASGYFGNRLLLQALKDRYTMVFADSQAHPSILEGIPEARPVAFYRHCSVDSLEELLKKNKRCRPMIITDGIFALSGEIAPLEGIYQLSEKYDAMLVIDDAHATGVLGKNGRGTPEYFHLDGAANLYQSETMSKALGAYGGFIAASLDTVAWIRSKSLFYGASTALPPPLVAAACASLRFVAERPERRERLRETAVGIRNSIRELGFSTQEGITPIIPIYFEEKRQADNLSQFLRKNMFIAPSVDYPVQSDRFIVRIAVSANHTKDQVDGLLDTLKKWRDQSDRQKNIN